MDTFDTFDAFLFFGFIITLPVAGAYLYNNRQISPEIFLFTFFTVLFSGAIVSFIWWYLDGVYKWSFIVYCISCFIVTYFILRRFFDCTKWLANIIFGLLACSLLGVVLFFYVYVRTSVH